MTRTYVFISAPYQGDAPTHDWHAYFSIHANIARVQETAFHLARLGYGVFAPHVHSAHAEVLAPDIPATYWYELDLHFLRACDVLLVFPGVSRGVDQEVRQANAWGIPICTSIAMLVAQYPPLQS